MKGKGLKYIHLDKRSHESTYKTDTKIEAKGLRMTTYNEQIKMKTRDKINDYEMELCSM